MEDELTAAAVRDFRLQPVLILDREPVDRGGQVLRRNVGELLRAGIVPRKAITRP